MPGIGTSEKQETRFKCFTRPGGYLKKGGKQMAALFTAFDTAGLTTSITGVLTVGVAIVLLYAGYRHIKKAGNKL